MDLRHDVMHTTARAGKGAMFLGGLVEVVGVGFLGASALGYLADSSDEMIKLCQGTNWEPVITYCKINYIPLAKFGGITVVVGFITYKIGRIQHWWENKVYY